MQAVGSEIWRCSGILCEGHFFVRAWRSCLRTTSRREANVLSKLVYKDNVCLYTRRQAQEQGRWMPGTWYSALLDLNWEMRFHQRLCDEAGVVLRFLSS